MTWSKEIFAKNLKKYMDIYSVTQKELAIKMGVSAPTVSDWVTAKKYPRIDKIEKLAAFFNILKSDLIEEKQSNDQAAETIKNDLTDEESEYVGMFRLLDSDGKRFLSCILKREVERSMNLIRFESKTISLPFVQELASAGTGTEFFNNPEEVIKLKENRLTSRADFAVRISGKSMRPLYDDGDIVLVHCQPAVNIGEIGVYSANGQGYIKKQGKFSLISVNPDYMDVVPVDSYAFKCFGKVLGKIENDLIIE